MLDVVADSENVESLRNFKIQLVSSLESDTETDNEVVPSPVVSVRSTESHDEETRLNVEPESSDVSARDNPYPRTIYVEMQVLFQRTMRNIIRHRSLLFMHVMISLGLGICGGLIFHHVTNDLAGFQNRTGAFYFILTFFGFASFSSMDLFIAERRIFVRETGADYYGAFSYFFAKSTLDALSLRVLPATIFAW